MMGSVVRSVSAASPAHADLMACENVMGGGGDYPVFFQEPNSIDMQDGWKVMR